MRGSESRAYGVSVATLDTHRAVTKLQDAGAPEPLAQAAVDVVEEAALESTKNLVTDGKLYLALLIQTGAIVAIAGAALVIAQWMFG